MAVCEGSKSVRASQTLALLIRDFLKCGLLSKLVGLRDPVLNSLQMESFRPFLPFEARTALSNNESTGKPSVGRAESGNDISEDDVRKEIAGIDDPLTCFVAPPASPLVFEVTSPLALMDASSFSN